MDFLVYKLTHRATGKYYYGRTQMKFWEKGYMGCGPLIVEAVAQFGAEAFDRVILTRFETIAEAKAEEARIITKEVVNDPMSYNQCGGGGGAGEGELNPMWGKKRPGIKKWMEQRTGEAHPMYGKPAPNTGFVWYRHATTNKGLMLAPGSVVPTGFVQGRPLRTRIQVTPVKPAAIAV